MKRTQTMENDERNNTIGMRVGTADDAGTLAELEKIIFPAEAWSEEMFRGEFSGLNPVLYLLLVDMTDGTVDGPNGGTNGQDEPEGALRDRVIGYAGIWLIQDEGHITNVGILPEYRRRGLAEMLVTALILAAEARGAVRETLEVRVSNAPAIALYEKLGFRPAGKRRGYYPDNHEDALIYWREKE